MKWQTLIDQLQSRFPPEVLQQEIDQLEVITGDPSVHANGDRIFPERTLLDSRSGKPCLIVIRKKR